ncbi:uncharacterized protein LOC127291437 [Leptopilina boulardi]|uniref:uncharacterized protein LOC127291437 n=1 Tax=Leptopilina boulardi TaxID=63433 RepID=UPI0021F5F02A|nr:uncharacterized protein LOC127291437 [Leptopilina boulardi]
MSDSEKNLEIWLEENLIPKLKACLNKVKSKVQYVISLPTDSIFMARVFLLDMKFFNNQGKIEDQVHLVVKRPPIGNKGRSLFNLDAAFHNEILFYTKFAKFNNDYPKFYYAHEKPIYDSVIVTQNINYQGYYLNSEKTNLDIKYILSSMREIAKFHANAYIMKDKNPEEFFEIVKNIQLCRKPPENNPSVKKSQASVPRIINYLKKNNYNENFCKKLEKFLFNGFAYTQTELVQPIEPLATLCHGDFLRNNVFFKKIKENNCDVIETKLIDFGMINYGSPCNDIAHFLYLSGTRCHRREKFQQVFDEYHKSLLENLKYAELKNLERFSKEAFLEDYKTHAFFGYSIAIIFLPVMLGLFEHTPGELLSLPVDEFAQLLAVVGGDEYTEILVQMILDLKDAGSLDVINSIAID